MKENRPVQIAAFGLAAALLVASRFFNLTGSCLWFDEIFGVHAATHSWNSILSFVSLDLIHPPLFYVLLKIWINVGGESLLWLRLFPAILSVAAVFPFIALCRELKLSIWTQILALVLFASNGSMIKYAQEVRMYSLLQFLSIVSIWLFGRFFFRNKSFGGLILVNILLVYTHYFGWFVILSEVVAIILFQRIMWRRIVFMFAAVLIVFAPWAIAVWQMAGNGTGVGQNIGWMLRPGAVSVFELILNLVEPFYFRVSSADPVSIYRLSIPLLIIFSAAVILSFLNFKKRHERQRRTMQLLGVFVVVPLVLVFAASWILPYSLWGTRHLIIVFAPALVIFAAALAELRHQAIKTAAVTLILLFSGYGIFIVSAKETPVFSWCLWDPLIRDQKADKIYVFEDLVAYHAWFALSRNDMESADVIRVDGIDGVSEDKAYFLPRGFTGVTRINAGEIDERQIAIAFRAKSPDETAQPLKTFLDRGYRIIELKTLDAAKEKAMLVYLEK